MVNTTHNLDDSINEYFEFIVKGHTYRFRHMNTEEMEELKTFSDDDAKAKEFMFRFIDKVDPKAPEFSEISKLMILPQWNKFREMIASEFNS